MTSFMTFNELKERATKDILSMLPGNNWEVMEAPIAKANRGVLTGITFCADGENGGPTIYAEDIYDYYTEGIPYGILIKDLSDSIAESYSARKEIFTYFDDISFDKVRDDLLVRLVDKKLNKALIEDLCYRDIGGDLALVADIITPWGTVRVSNGIAGNLGVTNEELFDAALKSMERLNPACMKDVGELLALGDAENILEQDDPVLPESDVMYALSNERGLNGAACLMYPGVMMKIREFIGSDFYVVPSSIHEVLIIKASDVEADRLQDLIRYANGPGCVVSPQEVLSNDLFISDGENLRRVPGIMQRTLN